MECNEVLNHSNRTVDEEEHLYSKVNLTAQEMKHY